jgi:hypothetical protein
MLRPALALVAITSCLVAQRTWVVDAQNGAGTDFADMPAAVAAAAPGDLVLTRPGIYTGFTTNKGLRIIAPQRATLLQSVVGNCFVVNGLPAGQTFTLLGFDAPRRTYFSADITNNIGRVALADLRSLETCGCGPLHFNPPAIKVVDCAAVTFDNVVNYGGPALSCTRSNVIATRCSFGSVTATDPMGDCLLVDGGEVDAVDCTFDARAASDVNTVPQPAVRLLSGVLRVRGTAAAMIQGGFEVAPLNPAAGIRATGGTLVLDPDVRINPNAGASVGLQLTGTAFTQRHLSAAVVRSATIGGALQAELLANANAPAVLLLGLPAPRTATSIGNLDLEAALLLPLASGLVGNTGVLSTTLTLPANLPRGMAIGVQGAADLGQGVELSSAAITLLR